MNQWMDLQKDVLSFIVLALNWLRRWPVSSTVYQHTRSFVYHKRSFYFLDHHLLQTSCQQPETCPGGHLRVGTNQSTCLPATVGQNLHLFHRGEANIILTVGARFFVCQFVQYQQVWSNVANVSTALKQTSWLWNMKTVFKWLIYYLPWFDTIIY